MGTDERPIDRTDSTCERSQEILLEVGAVLGKKWHPVILYQLSTEDELRFSDLRSRVSGISNKMLSDGLETLEDEGLVHRRIVEHKPVRVRYSLTERGETMAEVVEAMLHWGRRHLGDGDTDTALCQTVSDGGQRTNAGSAEGPPETVLDASKPEFDDAADPATLVDRPSLVSVMETLFGLTTADVETLVAISTGSGVTMETIAESVGRDRSYISRSVRQLCELGLIARRRRILPSGGQFFEHYSRPEDELERTLVDAVEQWSEEATSTVTAHSWEEDGPEQVGD